MDQTHASIVAVDIGNSQIKLGLFAGAPTAPAKKPQHALPEPTATLELPIAHDTGRFDVAQLTAWCDAHVPTEVRWLIGSVHRGAAAQLTETLATWSRQHERNWQVRKLSNQGLPLSIRVDEPARVGIDRLLAAVAANRLRGPGRSAIVVDLGTAITVDMVESDGGFAGGAILPGIGMAGRALADQTDALPHIVLDSESPRPPALGKSTTAAIQAGLYWGAVGAVSELVSQLTADQQTPPDVVITGGAAEMIFAALSKRCAARYEPHLVLAGIVLADGQRSSA